MSTGPTSAADARPRITELIRDARICLLTTTGVDGRLVSRPMVLQQVEFDGDLWFFAAADSAKIRHIRVNPQVNIGFSDQRGQSWMSVAGTAQEAWDRDRAERLWQPLLWTWFPDGPGTPGLTLIKVHAGSAEYWDAPGGAVVNLLPGAAVAAPAPPARAAAPAGDVRTGRLPGPREARPATGP